jgi:hypothetical protein
VCQEREVVTTEYRNEQTYEAVPTTMMENVTVDEGSYQTVWVPKLTTRPVARTVYQTRTAYRTVPYQVTRRVTDCNVQNDAYQLGRYAPASGTAIGYSTTPGYAVTSLPPVYSGSTLAAGTYPTLASPRITPTPVVGSSLAGSSSGRVPDARFAEVPVTPITPRSASNSRVAERNSLFVPAPSAAQVWRSTAVR